MIVLQKIIERLNSSIPELAMEVAVRPVPSKTSIE